MDSEYCTTSTCSKKRVDLLLRAVVTISNDCVKLADKRERLLRYLVQALDAKVGHWAWVRGRADSDDFMPVAACYYGYSPDELQGLNYLTSDPEVSDELFRRLQKILNESNRSDGGWLGNSSTYLADVIGDENNAVYRAMKRINIEYWMQAGKFVGSHAFSALAVARPKSMLPFNEEDEKFLDFAFTNIDWLHPTSNDPVPQDHVEQLTDRQRSVAFLLLSGMSRKQIAAHIGISSETVDHHIKAIFRHFEVHSATELAALFLRNK